jgi:hypothetical protein
MDEVHEADDSKSDAGYHRHNLEDLRTYTVTANVFWPSPWASSNSALTSVSIFRLLIETSTQHIPNTKHEYNADH